MNLNTPIATKALIMNHLGDSRHQDSKNPVIELKRGIGKCLIVKHFDRNFERKEYPISIYNRERPKAFFLSQFCFAVSYLACAPIWCIMK